MGENKSNSPVSIKVEETILGPPEQKAEEKAEIIKKKEEPTKVEEEKEVKLVEEKTELLKEVETI